jgi:hypothetical protein
VVDDESWPLWSETFPNFVKAAYTKDSVYTHNDIKDIVAYAFERGISITPEFGGSHIISPLIKFSESNSLQTCRVMLYVL